MHKTYEDCCKEVGLNLKDPPPKLSSHWVGYDAGNVVPCKNMNEAMKYSLYENVTTPESRKAHDEYFEIRHMQEEEATKIFLKSLREEYPYLSDELYNLCYAEAFSRSSDQGPDSVATQIIEVIDFVRMVRKAK